jgi:hypothetical protein
MNGDIPIRPSRLSGSVALNEAPQALGGFVLFDFRQVALSLHKAVAAPVAASAVGVEADRQVT